jgi:hypothetical protein
MTKPWKANGIGHILLRYCLIKHVVKEKTEGTERRRQRLKQLLDDLKKMIMYWRLQKEALARPQWRTRFGKGYGYVVTQTE